MMVDAVTGASIHASCDARDRPQQLTVAAKDDLILTLLPLVGQLEAALVRIAELEKRLAAFERPPKTPDNSSLPPSKGQKADRPAGDKPPSRSRPGFGRALEPNPKGKLWMPVKARPATIAAPRHQVEREFREWAAGRGKWPTRPEARAWSDERAYQPSIARKLQGAGTKRGKGRPPKMPE